MGEKRNTRTRGANNSYIDVTGVYPQTPCRRGLLNFAFLRLNYGKETSSLKGKFYVQSKP